MRYPVRRWTLAFTITTLVVLLASIGTASALWAAHVSTTPSNGTVNDETVKTITFSVTGHSATALYPGTSGGVTVSITNPYSADPITITGLSGTVSPSASGCTGAANFTVNSTPGGLAFPATLTAGQTITATLTGAVTMNLGAANACQSPNTITVTYSVTGKLG
jgi:hypothetical protein